LYGVFSRRGDPGRDPEVCNFVMSLDSKEKKCHLNKVNQPIRRQN
jgi:hypothetical protein